MAGLLTPEEILARTARRWASSDCAPFPCGLEVWRYANELTGLKPAPLPLHESRSAMLKLLRREGGLEEYARRLMLSIGWQEVSEPARGDVAVVNLPDMGATCTIVLGAMYMAKGPHRVLIASAPLVAAWSLRPCLMPSPPPLSLP